MSEIGQQVSRPGPGCLIQLLWFILIGCWLGQLWLVAAWLVNLTIIGLPLGVWMLNRIPQVMLLREPPRLTTVVRTADGRLYLHESEVPQPPLLLRALWFILIGWWASLIWLELAWLFCATIVLLPVALGMFASAPMVVSLRRS